MPHNAAMPKCIRKPLCLAGPQPLCPLVFASHLLTAGTRHAPNIQAMYPPVALCRLGHPRHLQVLSGLGSRLGLLSPTPYLRLEIEGTSWRHECWFHADYSSGLEFTRSASACQVSDHTRCCVAVISRHVPSSTQPLDIIPTVLLARPVKTSLS